MEDDGRLLVDRTSILDNTRQMDKKSAFLGMSHGTACYRLRKNLMFAMAHGRKIEPVCFRCGESIDSVDDLSIDHKQPWEGVSVALFWDLDNIAFSHMGCNLPDRPAPATRKIGPEGTSWCGGCKDFLPEEEFGKDSKRWSGLRLACNACESRRNRQRRGEPKPKVCTVCGSGDKPFQPKRRVCVGCYREAQRAVMQQRRDRSCSPDYTGR